MFLDEQRDAKLNQLIENFSQAIADQLQLDHYRKIKKAELMKDAELHGVMSAVKQEREALLNSEYKILIDGLVTATKEKNRLGWFLEKERWKFEQWRTLEANQRAKSTLI